MKRTPSLLLWVALLAIFTFRAERARAAQADATDWRANLTCPPAQQTRADIQYCTGTDRSGRGVHVIVVDLASAAVRFEYVLPKGHYALYDSSGRIVERSPAAQECEDPNVPPWGGPEHGCSVAGNTAQYPRLHLTEAVTRAAEVRQNPPVAAVIDADYGAPDATHGPEGLVVVRGRRLDGAANCDDDFNAALRPWLGLGETLDPAAGLIPAQIDRLPDDGAPIPERLYTAIGGGPWLVRDGTPYPGAAFCSGESTLTKLEPIANCNFNLKRPAPPKSETYNGGSCRAAPHTAAGISPDRRWLFLAVSTGDEDWEDRPDGADRPDVLAAFMDEQLGVEDALKFDGGGSSQFWMAGTPDLAKDVGGKNRPLTNFLAVYAPEGHGLTLPHSAANVDARSYLILNEGDAGVMDVSLRNDGSFTWKSEDGVALIEKTADSTAGQPAEHPLPRDVAPGQAVSWELPADTSGVRVHRFQMAQDDVTFGEERQFVVIVLPEALKDKREELERFLDELRDQGETELEELQQRLLEWIKNQGRSWLENILRELGRWLLDQVQAILQAALDAAAAACNSVMLLPALAALALAWTRRRR